MFITAQNLASSNLIRPALERLPERIEAVVEFGNVPIRGVDGLRRLGRMLRGTSPSFVAFKVLECNVHGLLALLSSQTVADAVARAGVRYSTFAGGDDPRLLDWLEELRPDYIVNTGPVFLGKRLRKAAAIATLNCHSARLPYYRGPANYIWTRLEGESETAFTIQRMVAKMDAGPVWDELRIPIDRDWSVYRQNHEVTRQGGEFLAQALGRYLEVGPPSERAQDEREAVVRSFPSSQDIRRLRASGVRLVRLRDVVDCR